MGQYNAESFLRLSDFEYSDHKRMRWGAGGGSPPQLWINFRKSAPFGQIFALSHAKMLANNGLWAVPLDFFFLYAYDSDSLAASLSLKIPGV